MSRNMTADSMVPLPKTTASSAVTLGEQLLTAADAEKGTGLPLLIERPRARMEVALSDLKAVLVPEEALDGKLAFDADWALDGSWRSFFFWTSSMASLPDGSFPELEKVRSLKATVFKDGLTFINLSYRDEWTQSESRLSAMEKGGFEPVIEQLGGGPLLKNLKDAHARYGEVLGIKAPLKVEQNPAIRTKMTALLSAMRSYVLKAAAWADPEDAASEVLSAALLLPLTKWKDKAPKKSSQEDATSESSSDTPDTANSSMR